ncbi:MAG: transcriptional repressor [Clostridiales bacterium]|jgi:Fe2+ or Zn2+ uptake regulation protein|nr:transcriptional repressor [Clostridiales bacterium]
MVDKGIIERKLKANNYKLTPQRRAIIDALFEHRGRFIAAGEIHSKTLSRHSGTDFSTVYRNLEILEKMGIIHKTNIRGGAAVYELICDHSHHHHIICKGCGKTEIISACPLEHLMEDVEDKGFTVIDHKFELYGYCSKCYNKR